ncbi:helix-turn-helix transcriptional regulator [Xylanimonas sp. McL0601]|uniref:helix-turn-helix transcriptional regulator n=1 Tax=Xylanimonas sp. McL0601 TaxID=3414739 RepID=UPI003CF22CE6
MPAPASARFPARLLAARGAHRRVPAEGPSHIDLRARVVGHIAAHAGDAELTPARLAADVGISPRTLERLFEHAPMSVAAHIAHARLDLALELLRDPRLAHLGSDDVAARAGFTSTSRLQRAVLTATGLTPSAYRARVLDGPFPGHAAHPAHAAHAAHAAHV